MHAKIVDHVVTDINGICTVSRSFSPSPSSFCVQNGAANPSKPCASRQSGWNIFKKLPTPNFAADKCGNKRNRKFSKQLLTGLGVGAAVGTGIGIAIGTKLMSNSETDLRPKPQLAVMTYDV